MHLLLQQYVQRPRERWILEWPGQVVLAVGQVGNITLLLVVLLIPLVFP